MELDAKLYRVVRLGDQRYVGTKDKNKREIGYILDLFPMGWFRSKTVLDIGCAGGAICFAVCRRGGSATGIDIDQSRITAAKKIASRHKFVNVSFIHGNVNRTPITKVDCIFLLNVLHHEKNPLILIDRCVKAAKFLCIEHPKHGYFSPNNDAYAESDQTKIFNWTGIETYLVGKGFKLVCKKKSKSPHVKGTRIVGLFKQT